MSDSQPQIIDRQAARVLLLDAEDRVLLLRCQEPGSARAFWITPGGGLEGEETHEQAAVRELREEIGLVDVELSGCVWTRSHTFLWLGRTYRQHERFFLARCDSHTVCAARRTDEEQQVLTEHRWWSVAALQACTAECFAPSCIGTWLAHLLDQGVPPEPIDVGA